MTSGNKLFLAAGFAEKMPTGKTQTFALAKANFFSLDSVTCYVGHWLLKAFA